MANTIEVIRPGSAVEIGPEGDRISGLVLQVSICSQFAVIYKIAYWSGKERKEEWFEDFEVAQSDPEKTTAIGFK